MKKQIIVTILILTIGIIGLYLGNRATYKTGFNQGYDKGYNLGKIRGAEQKSRQIAGAIEECNKLGGYLIIKPLTGGLELTCGKLKLEIQYPEPKEN